MDYVVLKENNGQGRIVINKSVFQAIADITLKDIENISQDPANFAYKPVTIRVDDNRLRIETDIRVKYGASVNSTCGLVQSKIYENIAFMTGFKPSEIKVNVIGFDI
ncbi:MAG: Asp23/Gls24 family envelope stress response protein [Solobacterium sp.]|nr:Asp23/Gls24 family envelope stress response protein [Solobacterium sp.]